ncbi:hypothetical protein CIL06_10865 [Pantoea vagans]|nr:hypothetical protein CIL06_10865 [Pantoea vagans]
MCFVVTGVLKLNDPIRIQFFSIDLSSSDDDKNNIRHKTDNQCQLLHFQTSAEKESLQISRKSG